jgi:hypothetical protein
MEQSPRFTLRQLFTGVAGVCIAAGLLRAAMVSPEPFNTLLFLGFLVWVFGLIIVYA